MKRALYLNANENNIIVVCDGPSVLIKEGSSAYRRIPVRLVNKVVITGNVKIDANSIMLFADNEVPIIFLRSNGGKSAVVTPFSHELASFYQAQKMILATQDNMDKYVNWAERRRMKHQLKNIRKYYQRARNYLLLPETGGENYRIIINNLMPQGDMWKPVQEIITYLHKGLIIEKLLKAKLDPHLGVIYRGHDNGLALDIAYMIQAEIDLQALQFFKSHSREKNLITKLSNGWHVTKSGIHNIIQRFENKKIEISNIVENIINEMFALIRHLKT